MPQWQEKQNCSRDVWKGKSRQYDHGPSADFKFPMNEWPNLAISRFLSSEAMNWEKSCFSYQLTLGYNSIILLWYTLHIIYCILYMSYIIYMYIICVYVHFISHSEKQRKCSVYGETCVMVTCSWVHLPLAAKCPVPCQDLLDRSHLSSQLLLRCGSKTADEGRVVPFSSKEK